MATLVYHATTVSYDHKLHIRRESERAKALHEQNHLFDMGLTSAEG